MVCRRAVLAAALLALAPVTTIAPVAWAAQNALLNGSVTPTTGSTSTPFSFSVEYRGSPPSSVVAVAGSQVVPLSLASGTAGDGTYRGTVRLPAGTHAVSFQATAQGRDPTLGGPTVTVTLAPPPTPGPTPPPTPVPTPAPTAPSTPVPTPPIVVGPPPSTVGVGSPTAGSPTANEGSSGAPTASPRVSGFVGGVLATVRPSPTRRPTTATAGLDDEGFGLLPGALAAVAILALIAILALARDRRRPRPDPRLAYLPAEARDEHEPQAAARPARPRAEWESYELDDLPVGTVEYRPPTSADGE